MKKIFSWLKATRLSFKIGLILGLLHFIFILWGVILVTKHPAGQWQFIWFLPIVIDFPISLLTVCYWAFGPDYWFSFLSYPIGELRTFIIPVIIHGGGGALWYLYLPVFIANLAKRIRGK